jgi:hypothetical protein
MLASWVYIGGMKIVSWVWDGSCTSIIWSAPEDMNIKLLQNAATINYSSLFFFFCFLQVQENTDRLKDGSALERIGVGSEEFSTRVASTKKVRVRDSNFYSTNTHHTVSHLIHFLPFTILISTLPSHIRYTLFTVHCSIISFCATVFTSHWFLL